MHYLGRIVTDKINVVVALTAVRIMMYWVSMYK